MPPLPPTLLTLALLTLLALLALPTPQPSFSLYLTQHHKSYPPAQEQYRRIIFTRNLQTITQHNAKNLSWKMGVTQFSDLTQGQFTTQVLGTYPSQHKPTYNISLQPTENEWEADIDWVALGKAGVVKNQGMCASCWAFSIVGSLESVRQLANQPYTPLSQQQLVDCSFPFGNNGCHGGELNFTLNYILHRGIESAQNYPYINKEQNCKKTTGPYKISAYTHGFTCTALRTALEKGPVSVAVDAILWAQYKEGVFENCGNEINHGVVVVGATKEYWRVKNSWGWQWGEAGFMRVARGNTCSICEEVYQPVL